MKNLRIYGKAPYNIAVIHGGPGGPGSMAPVAEVLSKDCGVLEPLQSKDTIEGQLSELANLLDESAALPITLIGHSWGAWLSYMFAAKFPSYVKRIILIGSGSYDTKYLKLLNSTRDSRLNEEENRKIEGLWNQLRDKEQCSDKVLRDFLKLIIKADSYEPISYDDGTIEFQPDTFSKIMSEVNELRKSFELLEMGRDIKCPVIAIHGDHDSHPYQGVKEPLSEVIADFKFILLENCGHSPWNEKYAKDKFFEILFEELSATN
ncbi:alpha/beta hydrolase [Wukongibacter baidiensis]|uniref:alpha/beta fold hydrolase n=1 Tax=Wukongibacter baidiensis TaxID=1723361 RepID=UPI003D7F48E4